MRHKMIVFGITLLFLGSLYSSFTPLMQADPRGIIWSCPITANETTGLMDYVVIGEAPDAHDGPPNDSYDVVKPPSPMIPYLRVWLNDSLPSPYDILWKDYRQYPGSMQNWELYAQWDPLDYSSPTTVTLRWNSTDLESSEYSTILLCTDTGTPLRDMLASSTYVFSCPAVVIQHFTIQAQRSNAPPHIPSAPSGPLLGYHGISYTYSTSTTDPENDTLYYRFDWGDSTMSGWLGPYQNGSTMSASHVWQAPGSYAVVVQARDNHGSESGWSDATMVTMMNRAPASPGNASPANEATGVSITPVLRWVCSDPDMDLLAYDVYFGVASSPPRVVENQSNTWLAPGSLSYQTTYYWRIIAKDGFGGITNGSLWSFTTGAEPPGGGGSPPSGENHLPVADASASDRYGIVGVSLVLNGSLSHDSDGYITKWAWDFGDGTTGNGEVTTHAYRTVGTFTVILTVTDNNGTTDTDTLQVVITSANHAPSKPSLEGTTVGALHVPYTFTMMSTDLDGDFLRYIVDWGDGTSTTSDFLPNGTGCSLSHSWAVPGKYLVEVTASDNNTLSAKTGLTVFIDVHFLGPLGYLYDTNGDTFYDTFYSNATGATTNVQRLSNGTYRIDSNGDGIWDYYYNPVTDTLAVITPVAAVDNQYIYFIIIAVALIVIVGIVYWYKKRP